MSELVHEYLKNLLATTHKEGMRDGILMCQDVLKAIGHDESAVMLQPALDRILMAIKDSPIA